MARNYPTIETIRAVWAELSNQPNALLRSLADALGCSYSTVGYAIRALRDAGYVEEEVQAVGTRRVLVPFVAGGLKVSRPGGWK